MACQSCAVVTTISRRGIHSTLGHIEPCLLNTTRSKRHKVHRAVIRVTVGMHMRWNHRGFPLLLSHPPFLPGILDERLTLSSSAAPHPRRPDNRITKRKRRPPLPPLHLPFADVFSCPQTMGWFLLPTLHIRTQKNRREGEPICVFPEAHPPGIAFWSRVSKVRRPQPAPSFPPEPRVSTRRAILNPAGR